MKIRLLYFSLCYIFFISQLFSQVSINTSGNNPNSSSMLDVSSTQHGMLIPRMTTSQRNAIKTPASGLIIYNTDNNMLNIYTNNGWYVLESISVGSSTGTLSLGGGVAINEDGSSPSNSAILDVKSTTRGVLLPRTTTGSISTPAQGLIIYNTSTNKLNYYNGSSWISPCQSFITNTTGTGSLSQIGLSISETLSLPDQSAILEIKSSNKGLLIPRLSEAQRNALSPVRGLLLYNTTSNKINYWNGSMWYEVLTAPPTIGAISGNTNVCAGTTQNYSISPVSGATSYTWTVPSGWTINSGQGTTSINVTVGTSSGSVSVFASNGCGNSTTQTLAITVNTIPNAPVAQAASNVADYSFTANWSSVSNATTYYLDVSTDDFSTFVAGYNNLNVGNVTSYNVTGLECWTVYFYRVRAGNACGISDNSNEKDIKTTSCK